MAAASAGRAMTMTAPVATAARTATAALSRRRRESREVADMESLRELGRHVSAMVDTPIEHRQRHAPRLSRFTQLTNGVPMKLPRPVET
ncbi:hypothetical protein GCM10009682_64110 [Luedemannella flava]|uniref:Uncharacterized protein n=1 Tax=Luedemannella flava TaxID=349316 RepID=A0ABN2MWI0_9ACTN